MKFRFPPRFYALLVFLGGASYGVLSTIVKTAYGVGFTVGDVSAGQALAGLCLLWPCVFLRGLPNLSWHMRGKIFLAGFPMGATTILYYHSLETLEASFAIILMFQFVWMTALLEHLFYGRRMGRKGLMAIPILLVGSLLSAGVSADKGLTPLFAPGAIWALCSALSYSFMLLFSGSLAREVAPLQKSAWMALGASVVVLSCWPPVAFLQGSYLLSLLPYAILLGVFGIFLPPLLFAIGIPKAGPGLSGVLASAELPVAVLMAHFVLQESVLPWQWFGVLLILAAILLANGRG